MISKNIQMKVKTISKDSLISKTLKTSTSTNSNCTNGASHRNTAMVKSTSLKYPATKGTIRVRPKEHSPGDLRTWFLIMLIRHLISTYRWRITLREMQATTLISLPIICILFKRPFYHKKDWSIISNSLPWWIA